MKLFFVAIILFTLSTPANSQTWCTCNNCGGSGWLEENQSCNGCGGSGQLTCAMCGGDGEHNCPVCAGSGTIVSEGSEVECPNCYGNRTVGCDACEGKGSALCLRCGGSGRIEEKVECNVCDRTGLVECP